MVKVKIKSGKDITIIFIGNLLNSYPKILNTLASKKINPEILYLNTLKPLDENLIINSLKKTRKLFIYCRKLYAKWGICILLPDKIKQ